MAKSSKSRFTFADLFAGIGGMRIAFEKAGGQCVLTCEIDQKALTTYKLNFRDSENHKYVQDVLTLKGSELTGGKGTLDVLVAGFPCQPYSIAGLRKGLEDDRGGEIFKALLKILSTGKPKAFLLENVRGIKSHEKGETFAYMLRELSKCGYTLRHETLNSMKHANVPQTRERVFIIGFRDGDAAEKFAFPGEIELTKTIHDCLETEKVDGRFYYDERYGAFSEIKNAIKSKDTLYQWRRHYVRENKSNACPTLTANMGSGGHNVPLVKDSFGIRKLTPRETANFQGFPKTFKLPENLADSHLYHQFGNSVTVPLIEKIAKQIAKVL